MWINEFLQKGGNKKALRPEPGDERQPFRGTTRIRALRPFLGFGRALSPLVTGGGPRPALAGRSRANQAVRFQGGFQPVTAPLCETDTRYFPVLRISTMDFYITKKGKKQPPFPE